MIALALTALTGIGEVSAQSNAVSINGSIIANTCTLNTPNLTVDLGQVSVGAIMAVGVGSPIPASTPVTIQLTCQAGANVAMTMQDAATPGSTLPYIALTPATGVAGGVGIQLARASDNSAVPLGPNAQWTVATNVTAGVLSIPLQAHYYRTASGVGSGAANAGALFTLEYP
ncbi:type 1 fimbrial protein [Dyella monticola]|uniref:Type 1 fimbrial protein n=1 Tax=Dyella monticola TaxID=1927958 RepID=A0A370X311_9GAMM|nr:fimbrial protein [Dyella monticola]RDS82778.1 type 1 fimbrial protein [Dyella monticola]